MGHKVKNYSANHRDEITRAGKTGKKKAASVAACCSREYPVGTLIFGTLICYDDYD
jgi:hypothetical protein